MTGTLFGVGLGPGDPELMTLRAHRLISSAGAIAYPVLERGESLARAIAAEIIPQGAREIPIVVPMTPARAPAQAAYDRAAAEIAGLLEVGQDVVSLCEGDPLFYGSFMYLHARLAPRFPVEVVPGVTSLTAAAARAGLPLAARGEAIAVVPATLDDEELARRIRAAESVALIKVGRHLGRLRRLLEALGLAARAVYVERATMADERVLPLAAAPEPAPYFSIVLVTRGADPWL